MSIKTRLSKLESSQRSTQSLTVFLRAGDDREAKLREAYERQGLKPNHDDAILFIEIRRISDNKDGEIAAR